ncbi:hypothetical protein C922_04376 [Plasmodium inui San Antonio 1]|uniref:Uncharacterized protein n=1 Tax=Plasmodium inui San Antonio 1 TaxID=1237626 RepID=W6ZWS6_9APIC|nr:hypothetical protein C922_04376 [Plasmodium inui San Antonio 1]EUD65247.1 hypothetical protein C922_04376 [Plasmodium inui San Antonio 1]
MVTRRNGRQVLKKIAERYLPSVNIAHLVCSTLLLNYLVAYLVVTCLWFPPRGEKGHLVGEEKWTSPSMEEQHYTHRGAHHQDDFITERVCLAYVLFCILCYVPKVVTIWGQTRGKKGSQLEGSTNGPVKHESVLRATGRRRQMWMTGTHLIRCLKLWIESLERPLSPFRLWHVGREEESTPVRVPPKGRDSPEGASKRRAASQVGTNTVDRKGREASGGDSDAKEKEENPNRRGNSGGNRGARSNRGVSSHLEATSPEAQSGGTIPSEEKNDASSNTREKHHMEKGVENHSGSDPHEESSDSQGELCERVRTNAYKYRNFYHQYCKGGRGEGGDAEEESSSMEENSFLKCPTWRERRKFNVIEDGGDLQNGGDVDPHVEGNQNAEEIASPEETPHVDEIPSSPSPFGRHTGRGKKGFNLGSAKMRSLNDRRSYTSLYFPSVIETDSEGGSISEGNNGGGDNGGSGSGGSDEHIRGASPCKEKEKPPSEEGAHNHVHPRRGAYERDKLEGGEEVGTFLNEKGDEGFSAGRLLNDVNRRGVVTNTSMLPDGKYLQTGTEKKKKRKKHHCVYFSPDGVKCSHSNHGEDKAFSGDPVSSDGLSGDGVNSLEAQVRMSLSNFKKKKEVLTFIKDTYKTILIITILSLLLTKGILMCTFLYFLQSAPVALSPPLPPRGVFPLLQVCHFALFHLYVREYAARRQCGPT